MPRGITLLLFSLLLTGCLRGCGGGEVSPLPVEELPEVLSGTGETAEEPMSPSSSVSVSSSSETSSSSSVNPEEQRVETEKFVVSALTWAQDLRAVFSAIGKLHAIAVGKYTLKEGETVPDIHATYAKLHADLANVAVPPGQEDLLALMQELERDLGSIVKPLSAPPTAAELSTANERRDALRDDIDTLYTRLQGERPEG